MWKSLREPPPALELGPYRRLPYPSNVIIDIHSYCNAACKTCPYRDLSKALPMGKMDEALFTRIIDEFSAIKRDHQIRGHVIFCNMGELLIDPGVFEKIEYVLRAGLEFVLQTNAFLLTPEKTERLIATGFNGPIYISGHGITPGVYRDVMGLDLSVTLRNIDYLLTRYPKDRVHVRAIPYEWPVGEALKVKRYWKGRGVALRIFLPNSRAGLVDRCASWSFKYPGNRLKACKTTLPLRDMVISFDGEAVLCCHDMGRRAVLGNVAGSSLQEVWNSAQARDLLEKVFLQKPSPDDFICKTCEFGLSTKLRRLVKAVDDEWHRLVKCHL